MKIIIGTFWLDSLDINLNELIELIEDEQRIDIQNIKEYTKDELEYMCPEDLKPLAYKCNELVQAVKYLDYKLKEK